MKTQGRTLDCPLISVHHVLLQGGFLICVAGTLWLNEGVRAVCSKTCSLTPWRKCNVGRGATDSTGRRDPGKAQPAVLAVVPRVAGTLWLNEGV